MDIHSVTCVSFSPTGTTQTIIKNIAEGLQAELLLPSIPTPILPGQLPMPGLIPMISKKHRPLASKSGKNLKL